MVAGTEVGLEGRLDTTLRSLCDPPPPGFRPQMSVAATLLGVAGVMVFAVASRLLLGRVE